MLVAAFAPDAKLGQPGAQQFAGFAIGLGQPQAKCPVGKAESMAADEVVAVDAPAGEVGPRRGHGLQPLLVIVGHLLQQRGVVGLGIERARQHRHSPLAGLRTGQVSGFTAIRQDLERVTEADAVVVLHELDRVAGFSAGHAMPQPFVGRDDEVGRALVAVERAQPFPVFAAVLL